MSIYKVRIRNPRNGRMINVNVEADTDYMAERKAQEYVLRTRPGASVEWPTHIRKIGTDSGFRKIERSA